MVGKSSQELNEEEPTLLYVTTPSDVVKDNDTYVVWVWSFSLVSISSVERYGDHEIPAVATISDTVTLVVTVFPP